MNTNQPPSYRRFAVPVLAGAVLRLLFLTRQNLWIDEILTLRAASVGEPFRWADVLLNPQGPLPQVWLRIWILGFGDGDLGLRLWSSLAGIATLVLAAVVFRRLIPAVAVLAVWLLALSPFHIWYSQEVRNYVFLAAASLVVLGTLIPVLDRPTFRSWLGHALALSAMLLCNLSGLFVFPAAAAWVFLVRRRGRVAWTLAAVTALAVASPWIVEEAGGHVDWRGLESVEIPSDPEAPSIRGGERLHPGAIPFAYVSFLGGFGVAPPVRLLHGSPPLGEWLRAAPGLLALAGGVVILGAGVARRRRDPRVQLLLLWAALPMLAAAVVAALGLKAFNPRYLTAVQPVIPAILAVGAGVLGARSRRWGVGLLVAVMLWGWARQTFVPAFARDDFRSAAAFLHEAAGPRDLILQQGVDGPLQRYYAGPTPIATYFGGYFSRAQGGQDQLRDMVAGYERVWWVGSRLWYEDPEGRVPRWLAELGNELPGGAYPGVLVRGFMLQDDGS